MSRLRLCLSLVLGILILGGPSVCRAGDALRFGILPVVDALPLHVGIQKDLFRMQGIDLELISFQSALERDAALQSGKLDGYFGDLLNTIILISAGHDLGIVSTAFHTSARDRMFGIVTAPEAGIGTLEDLKGREVAISKTTVIEFLLDRILAQKGLSSDFVQKQDIKQIPIRLQMLLAGRIPSALLPEPMLTLAEIKGGRVLADDRQLDTSLTVLALDRERLKQAPDLGPRFLRALGQAVELINGKPEEFRELLLTQTRFPAQAANDYQIPRFPQVGPPTSADVSLAEDWLEGKGLVGKRPAYEDVVVLGLQ